MKHLGKIVELENGEKVFLNWDEVYSLSGLVEEDFLYDSSGQCYHDLVQCIKQNRAMDELAKEAQELNMGY